MGQFVTEIVTEEIIALKKQKNLLKVALKKDKKEAIKANIFPNIESSSAREDRTAFRKKLKKDLLTARCFLKAFKTVLNAIETEKETENEDN